MLQEFDKCFKKIDTYFKLIGLSICKEDSNRTIFQRLKYHWLCSVNTFFFDLSIVGQIIWLFWGIATGQSFLQITFLVPCITLCLLARVKLTSYVYYAHKNNNVIAILRNLHSVKRSHEEIFKNILTPWIKFLSNVLLSLSLLCAGGVIAFATGPFIIMASVYYTTGKFELFLPFIVWYPFDAFQPHAYPFVFGHQLWSAWVAVCSVLGTDGFFFTCCTFIHTQFLILHHDIEQLVKVDASQNEYDRSVAFKMGLVEVVNRHRNLIGCVELLNTIYAKGTFFNVASSSIVICATGFNLVALKSYALMAPFICFVNFGMLQIFFYCYYGDYVMRSSTQIGDAIYNSHWYKAGVMEKKYLLTILVRSQKPCKFTAYLFNVINFTSFTRILSTSWSYFALLNQMYQK